MDTPTTVTFDHPVPPITDPQMDTNKVYEQEHERPQQVSPDQPIQLAQNDVPTIPTADTHHIVQAPDGAKVAFPKGTPPDTMHQEMTKWWQPRVQQATAVLDSLKTAASNAAQVIGLPSDQPEWQLQTDEFMRDPIGKSGAVVGALVGGLAHGLNSIIPNTPENQALVQRAQAEHAQGNNLAAATTMIPLIGDGTAKSIKQAQAGQWAASFGTAFGTAAPFAIDALKGEGELPITREKPVQPTTTSYEHTPDQSGQFGNYEHVVTTKNAEGKTVGHLAAQDTAPGEVTIRSNQIYDDAHRGQGKGTAAIRTLVDETAKNPSLKTIHSDITTTGAARGAWEKIADANPDTVTKQDFNGVPRWSVDLDKVRDKAANAPEFNGEERRGAGRGPLMKATDIENNLKTGQPVSTPFDNTEGAMDTINRDLATRLEQTKRPTPAEDTAFFNKKEAEAKAKAQTVGTAKGAANDTALFNKAKEELGAGASISDIARRAQAMKIAGTPTPEELTKPPMEVRHWSKGGVPLTETDPEKFGMGRAGAETARRNDEGFIPRTYFGMEGYKEPAVQSGLEHSASLDRSKFYDKDADPKSIWKDNFKPSDTASAATNAERAVKEAGYSGYYSPEQQVLASFDKVPVKANPEAAQIAEHNKAGGSTFGPNGKTLAGTNAWSIGERPDLTVTVDQMTPEVLRNFKAKNAKILNDGEHAVGTWKNDEGKTVLDVVRTTSDRAEAESLARAANQQAMYHLGTGELADTGGTGEVPKNSAIPTHHTDIREAIGKKSNRAENILQGNRNFRLTDADGKLMDVFFSIDKDGLITGVINNAHKPGMMGRILEEAKKNGGVTGMIWDGNKALLDKYKDAGFEVSSHAPYNDEKYGAPSQALRDYWSKKLGWKEGDAYPGVTFTKLAAEDKPFKASDLWNDETGTYTSGQFMKYLAKNKLMSKAGSETLDAAAKKDFVPGWAEVSQFLTPEDRAQASKSVQKNVVDLVNKFNPEWVADAAKAGSAAKGWYSRATGLIQHMFGDEAHRFTNFVASLSPQKDVEQNFTDALNFYNMWQDAGKPLGPDNEKVIRDLTERAEVGMSGQVARNQLYENLVNEVQPTGPKVSNFARNLKGNMDAVTKDRWMAYLFGNNERMFRWFKEGSPKPAVHLAADALIRAVGQSINMLPAEVQETSWSFLRTVVNLTEKEKISPKEAIGRVNDTLIREGASELTRLIADSPKVQSALNRLATATGDERFRADNLQNSPRFKQLLQEHQEQPSTGGGVGAINRAGAERGVKQAIAARSEISQAKKAKAAAPSVEKPALKKAPKDKATEFNPEDMSENIRPALSERMKNALS